MNSRQATSLGLNYRDAPSQVVSTAAGRVQGRQITLNRVSLGDIELTSVTALVLEGDFPEVILLGNSFLSRLEMNNQGSVMILTAPF
jgi:aspartyl protease family protein